MVRQMKSVAVRLWRDERGASLLEYSVLIGLIMAGAVATIFAIGQWTGTRWTNLKTELDKSGTTVPTQ